jgi:hypothetical protein
MATIIGVISHAGKHASRFAVDVAHHADLHILLIGVTLVDADRINPDPGRTIWIVSMSLA